MACFFLLFTWAYFHDQIILDRDFCVLCNRVYIKAKAWACQSQGAFFESTLRQTVDVNAWVTCYILVKNKVLRKLLIGREAIDSDQIPNGWQWWQFSWDHVKTTVNARELSWAGEGVNGKKLRAPQGKTKIFIFPLRPPTCVFRYVSRTSSSILVRWRRDRLVSRGTAMDEEKNQRRGYSSH